MVAGGRFNREENGARSARSVTGCRSRTARETGGGDELELFAQPTYAFLLLRRVNSFDTGRSRDQTAPRGLARNRWLRASHPRSKKAPYEQNDHSSNN